MLRRHFIPVPIALCFCAFAWSNAHAVWPTSPTQNVRLTAAINDQESSCIVSDGANGAIVGWKDSRSGALDIYARRVNANGDTLWAGNGVALCTASGLQSSPAGVADGFGGAILIWTDLRRPGHSDIYIRRVSGAGTPLWTADGVEVCPDCGGMPAITSDGTGGAIVAWGGLNGVRARRFDASGVPVPAWGNGVQISVNASGKPVHSGRCRRSDHCLG